ncbi:MAG: hypothetical protein Q9159_003113 [Coniocarpon cinnabarinum]
MSTATNQDWAILGSPICFSIFSAVTCILVAVRLYTRFHIKRDLRWEDYLMIPALVRLKIAPSSTFSSARAKTTQLFSLGWGANQLARVYTVGTPQQETEYSLHEIVVLARMDIVAVVVASIIGLIIVACLPALHQLRKHYMQHKTFNRIPDGSSKRSWVMFCRGEKTVQRPRPALISTEKFDCSSDAPKKQVTTIERHLGSTGDSHNSVPDLFSSLSENERGQGASEPREESL